MKRIYFRNAYGKVCRKSDATYVEINGAEISVGEYNRFIKLSKREKEEELIRLAAEGTGTKELRAYGDDLILARSAAMSKIIKEEDPAIVQDFLKRKKDEYEDSIARMSDSEDPRIQHLLAKKKREYTIIKEIVGKGVIGAVFSRYNRRLALKTEEGLLIFDTANDLCGEIESNVFGKTELHTIYATRFFLTAKRAQKNALHFAAKDDVIAAGDGTPDNDTLLLRQMGTSEFVGVKVYEEDPDSGSVWAFAGAYEELNLREWLSKNKAKIPAEASIRYPIRRTLKSDIEMPAVMDIEIRDSHFLFLFPVKDLSLKPLAFRTHVSAKDCEWRLVSPKVRNFMTSGAETIIM